jgi:hypothetical protein
MSRHCNKSIDKGKTIAFKLREHYIIWMSSQNIWHSQILCEYAQLPTPNLFAEQEVTENNHLGVFKVFGAE